MGFSGRAFGARTRRRTTGAPSGRAGDHTVVLVAEVVGAFLSGSLALIADAGHMLSDVAGLSLAWFAATLARRAPTDQRTWGYRRAEVLAAAGKRRVLLGGRVRPRRGPAAVRAPRRGVEPDGRA